MLDTTSPLTSTTMSILRYVIAFTVTLLLSTHNSSFMQIDPRGALKDSCTGKSVLVTGAGRGIGKVRLFLA